jgi:hypothetical protein
MDNFEPAGPGAVRLDACHLPVQLQLFLFSEGRAVVGHLAVFPVIRSHDPSLCDAREPKPIARPLKGFASSMGNLGMSGMLAMPGIWLRDDEVR